VRSARSLLVVLAIVTGVAACTLPTDDEPQALTGPEIESAMNPTTTSTTRPVGTTRDRELFFFDEDTELVAVLERTPFDADIAQILNLLAPSDEERDLRTALPNGFLVSETDLSDGTLTVVLADESLFDQIGGDQLQQAVAQIVLTATQLEDSDIREVRFEFDGEPQQVPTGDGLNADTVDACDYRRFLPGENCTTIAPAAPTTTSTTDATADISGN
jgi:spore germination protein GerM